MEGIWLQLRQAVDRLWNYTESLNILNKDHWKQSVNEKLKDFQLSLFKAVKEGGWGGSDDTTTVELQWSFTGALLYSVSVITTIGYGHIAPKTVAGRLVTIAYAVVGIPLMLLCLVSLGKFLAGCFRAFYTQVLCCMCCDKKTNGEPSVTAVRSEMAPTFIHPKASGMDNKESMHGDFIDESAIPQSAVICTLEDDRDKPPVTIPVVVTLMFMAGYIFCGTLLFAMWGKNWDYVEGSYFCFITLSTIGFGDFVPGMSVDSWHNDGKKVMCSLYLLFGLATVAMCFELMQAQVRETCRSIRERIGILQSEM